MDDQTGVAPLTYVPPTVELEGGVTLQMRRLHFKDSIALGRALGKSAAAMDQVLGGNWDWEKLDVQMVIGLVISLLPAVGDELLDLMASICQIPKGPWVKDKDHYEGGYWEKGSIRDHDFFPAGSEFRVIEALFEHKDVDRFFDGGRKLAKHPRLASMFTKPSEPSNDSSSVSSEPTPG
ncbi:MAG: hypothetical protein KAY24_18280 [Candidatus Eisenbacteria sp.]|nr:hypothetical protein [Candidatus Eisenbacteria bacterium]